MGIIEEHESVRRKIEQEESKENESGFEKETKEIKEEEVMANDARVEVEEALRVNVEDEDTHMNEGQWEGVGTWACIELYLTQEDKTSNCGQFIFKRRGLRRSLVDWRCYKTEVWCWVLPSYFWKGQELKFGFKFKFTS